MKNVQNTVIIAVIFAMLISVCGCEEQAKTTGPIEVVEAKPLLYPPPPDKPRVQYLTSISGSKDLDTGAAKDEISGFEKFLVGEAPEHAEDDIKRPYGIDMYDNKIYVCDVEKKLVEKIDLVSGEFGYLTKERRMTNPVNIVIDRGWKYIADPIGGAVFVYGKDDVLKAILGKELEIKPADLAVRGRNIYVTDLASNQVVVLDRITGEEVNRFGSRGTGEGKFALITGITLDGEGNVYVTDKVMARVIKFDKTGLFQFSFGSIGDAVHTFVRPKGIDIDREGRIWIVDSAPQVAKVYNSEGQLMMFFGGATGKPGGMSMPADILIDYDHLDHFKKYFTEGAEIEFLVFVTNQFLDKINVYGFGQFPVQEAELKLELEQVEEELKQLEFAIPDESEMPEGEAPKE